jgi:hypothetical protein
MEKFANFYYHLLYDTFYAIENEDIIYLTKLTVLTSYLRKIMTLKDLYRQQAILVLRRKYAR